MQDHRGSPAIMQPLNATRPRRHPIIARAMCLCGVCGVYFIFSNVFPERQSLYMLCSKLGLLLPVLLLVLLRCHEVWITVASP